ncbi:MAG TPA: hypothetical protein PLA94_06195 [Myxococcota bacterium]|nr:hypothetical protein [Myxococcota bacterium]
MEALKDLYLVGSTYNPATAQIPCLLSPVFRRGTDGPYLVPLEGNSGAAFAEEPEETIQQWREEGRFFEVDRASKREGYVLARLPEGPVYLRRTDYEQRLCALSRAFVGQAAADAHLGEYRKALDQLLVAARATPREKGLWWMLSVLAKKLNYPGAAEGYLEDGHTNIEEGRKIAARTFPELFRVLSPQSWKDPYAPRSGALGIFSHTPAQLRQEA